eukprot:8651539-Heterocapsa_arctica.AAC.1
MDGRPGKSGGVAILVWNGRHIMKSTLTLDPTPIAGMGSPRSWTGFLYVSEFAISAEAMVNNDTHISGHSP